MEAIKTKYERTKLYDAPVKEELESAQDIFPVEAIDESGIFALPNNRYSKSYKLSDINFAGVTDEEQKAIIVSYSKVLKGIPCRYAISVANEYVDEKDFHEKVLYKMHGDSDDELRKSYNGVILEKLSDAKQGLYQSIYLTLTITADGIKDAKGTFLSIEGAIRSAFVGLGLNGMQGSNLKALSIDERMQLIYNFMHTGLESTYQFSYADALHRGLDFRNILSPAAIEFGNEEFLLNGSVGKVFYIDEYPKTLESDIIASLSSLNCTSYVTVNNELLDLYAFKQEVSRKYMSIGMKIEGEKQRNRNNNDYLADASQKLLNEKEKLDSFLKDIDSLDDHYFNSTILVLILADTKEELMQLEEKLQNIAALKSLTLKSCFSKQKEALNSALIFGCQEFKRVVNLSSSCLAMFMPFKTQELNDENGVYYGINQLSQNAIFADKKKLKNHNGLILGQSGSGKSVFSKSEIISIYLISPMDQILIVDPQSEYGPVVEKMHGTVISFDSKKAFYLNPMDVDFEGVDYAGLQEIVAEKADFILTLISSLLKRDISAEEQSIIDKVMDKVYSENYSMRKRLNGEVDKRGDYEVPEFLKADVNEVQLCENLSKEEQIRAYSPTLQDVYQGLKDYGTSLSEHLAAAMEIFVNGSLNLFNHRTNVDLSNRLIAFDIAGLKDNLRVPSMIIMMETLQNKIKTNATKNRWTHLYIDEFHELLGVPQVADFVLKLWKEIRKLNGTLNGITQNMSDLLNEDTSGRLSAILSNTEYFALLSQSSMDKKKLMEFLPTISPAMFNFVDNAESGTGLLKMGSVCVPFDMRMSKDSEIYKIVNTDGGSYGV